MTTALTIVHLGPGQSEHIRRLARDQAARGHRVVVVTDEAQGPYPPLQGVAYRFYSGRVRLPRRARQIRAVLEKEKADVLHSHYLNVGGFLGVATGFHPHLMHGWGSDVFIAPHYSQAQLLKTRLALRTADFVLSPSTVMRDELSRLGLGLKHNEALAWGIDTRHFAPKPAEAATFRKKYGLDDGLVVFSPRALQPLYHQDKLVEAWARVLLDVPNARLLLSRYGAEAPFALHLENLIAKLGLGANVSWLEPLDYDGLPGAYSAADVVVSIPRSDAPAITVLEAMACARPVVVSDLPALHEIVRDGVNGRLVNVHSPEAIAEGLVHVLKLSPAEREAMGAVNRKFVDDNLGRDKTLDRIDAIYRNMGAPVFAPMRSFTNLLRGGA